MPSYVRQRRQSFNYSAFREQPAVHRFPSSMAARVPALAQTIVDDYDGKATEIWTKPGSGGTPPTGALILKRLKALPGYGPQKAKIFLALLGKQFGLTITGWRESAGDYGAPEAHLSMADVTDEQSLHTVRQTKKALKAVAKQAKTEAGK